MNDNWISRVSFQYRRRCFSGTNVKRYHRLQHPEVTSDKLTPTFRQLIPVLRRLRIVQAQK